MILTADQKVISYIPADQTFSVVSEAIPFVGYQRGRKVHGNLPQGEYRIKRALDDQPGVLVVPTNQGDKAGTLGDFYLVREDDLAGFPLDSEVTNLDVDGKLKAVSDYLQSNDVPAGMDEVWDNLLNQRLVEEQGGEFVLTDRAEQKLSETTQMIEQIYNEL